MPDRICETCTKNNKIRWGCDGGALEPLEIDGEAITQCPRRFIMDEPELTTNLFWLYRRYDKALLPEDGGLWSQPHKLMQALRVMEAAFSKVEKETADRRNRKATQAQERRGMVSRPKVR
jgi:hypothetical protein